MAENTLAAALARKWASFTVVRGGRETCRRVDCSEPHTIGLLCAAHGEEAGILFWSKVDKNGPFPDPRTLAAGMGRCWVWTASLSKGYGQVSEHSAFNTTRAYRWSYEWCVGPIPEGLHVDHLCRNRSCVNPEHLEPVPQGENNRRSGPFRRKKSQVWQ
jgi:hypothetical protein